MITMKPMKISDEDYKKVSDSIEAVREEGKVIRSVFESNYEEKVDLEWEVDSAVAALEIFSTRWTIEILASIFLAGPQRFNELRKLLKGISSRTLSDKLKKCESMGLVIRDVQATTPIKVVYRLSEHGKMAGRLLGPVIAYQKLQLGRVVRHSI